MEELLVLFFRAESHHPFDAGAVVPAAVEQDHFSAGGKMRHIALEVPLGAFALARSRQPRDPADPRMTPPFPAASRPSEMITTLSFCRMTQSCSFTSSPCRRSNSLK